VAVISHRDAADQQELDIARHQLLEDRLNVELRQGAGGVPPLPLGT
jgi:hypothetical protein